MVSNIQAVDSSPHSGKRIVFTTAGSLGDLHPYLALGLGLKARGHDAVVATSEYYRAKVEGLGLGFRPVRPDAQWMNDPDLMRRMIHFRKGTERVLREMVLPTLRQSYEDTLLAAEGADLLVSHPLTYATRLVAEKTGIPWASSMPAPIGLFSAHAPPLLPGYPGLTRRLRFLGPSFWRPMGRFLRWATRIWARPLDNFRAEIGLPPTAGNPLVEMHSPSLVLALFSPLLAVKQPDWPPQTAITGFPFFDRDGHAGLPADLARFLESGPPPVVFTLGSAAVFDAGRFYEYSIEATRLLGHRAVLVIGKDPRNRPSSLPEGILAVEYAPFSLLFPAASVIVHPGGIGTTAQAMRAGHPMLVMPYSHDQPDNADRAIRLGIARTISRQRYTAARAAAQLRILLENREYHRRAQEVSQQIRQEDGVGAACDAIERMLYKPEAQRHPQNCPGQSSSP